jgi:hypothetical protein
MIRIRLAHPDRTPQGIAEARAELARLTADQRPTFLGWSRRRAVAIGVALALTGAAIGAAIPASTPCVIVEAGPTGPEPDVTLGRIVEACADGTYRTTTYVLGTALIVDVDEHDGELTAAEVADLAERLATIRAERSGGRWSR